MDQTYKGKKAGQEQKEEIEQKTKGHNKMGIEELEGLPKLFITPIEK